MPTIPAAKSSFDRAAEIRRLNRLSLEELSEQAAARLEVLDDIDAVHRRCARSIASRIADNNRNGAPTTLILPYGPVGQYPYLRDIVNGEGVSFAKTALFFMDEYADADGRALAPDHPLSFRGGIDWLWREIRPELRPEPRNVVFPDESNADSIAARLADRGGVDVCYGGIGIHGHIAFNEPETGVRDSDVRLVELNDFTITINAVRAGVGGDLENFPRRAWTLGMRQCLGARRIELYCRNDIAGLDWANTVLRLAVLGAPGDDYPVTWIRGHADHVVVTDRRTACPPHNLL